MESLLVVGWYCDLAVEDYALILGGELTGQQVDVAHNAERDAVVALEDVDLLALGGTMKIDGIIAIPHKINWHAIGLTIQIYHRQVPIMSIGKDFTGPCFVEQTVLPSDFTIVVLQIE